MEKAKMNGTKGPFSFWISWRNIPTTKSVWTHTRFIFTYRPGSPKRKYGHNGIMAENKPKEKPCNKRTTTLLTESSNRQETKIKVFFQEQIHKKKRIDYHRSMDSDNAGSFTVRFLGNSSSGLFLSREHSIVKQGPTIQARAKNFWDCHDAHNVTKRCHKLWA